MCTVRCMYWPKFPVYYRSTFPPRELKLFFLQLWLFFNFVLLYLSIQTLLLRIARHKLVILRKNVDLQDINSIIPSLQYVSSRSSFSLSFSLSLSPPRSSRSRSLSLSLSLFFLQWNDNEKVIASFFSQLFISPFSSDNSKFISGNTDFFFFRIARNKVWKMR